jgi:hypothetical protein
VVAASGFAALAPEAAAGRIADAALQAKVGATKGASGSAGDGTGRSSGSSTGGGGASTQTPSSDSDHDDGGDVAGTELSRAKEAPAEGTSTQPSVTARTQRIPSWAVDELLLGRGPTYGSNTDNSRTGPRRGNPLLPNPSAESPNDDDEDDADGNSDELAADEDYLPLSQPRSSGRPLSASLQLPVASVGSGAGTLEFSDATQRRLVAHIEQYLAGQDADVSLPPRRSPRAEAGEILLIGAYILK